jgi:hypothetical protein
MMRKFFSAPAAPVTMSASCSAAALMCSTLRFSSSMMSSSSGTGNINRASVFPALQLQQTQALSFSAGGVAAPSMAVAQRFAAGGGSILERLNKKIIKAGSGPTPPRGARVRCHYTGTLTNGKQFDSSRGRGEFSFRLGAGEVIPAWDACIASMTKGEICEITAPPDLAYGAQGYPPVIPPNSHLIFDIELLGWN